MGCFHLSCGLVAATRPLVPRSGQSPLGGAFQCSLQIAWTSDLDRWVLAQPTRTAVYGPVRTVVWQGSAGDRRPYADLVLNPEVMRGTSVCAARVPDLLAARDTCSTDC